MSGSVVEERIAGWVDAGEEVQVEEGHGGAKRACEVGFERCVGTLVHEETGAT